MNGAGDVSPTVAALFVFARRGRELRQREERADRETSEPSAATGDQQEVNRDLLARWEKHDNAT